MWSICKSVYLYVPLFTLVFSGCRNGEDPPSVDLPDTSPPLDLDAPAVPPQPATAQLSPTQGNQARGTVTFTPANGMVKVAVNIAGLAPGRHGFHVHENGDCSAPDASSAGEHFNPIGMPHGGPGAGQRHVGDLGNVIADASGQARTELEDSLITLEGASSIVGRALVVHAEADDLTSQPSGNSGKPVACGVIGRE